VSLIRVVGQTIKINVEFVDPLGGGPMAVSLNGQAPALATAIIADNQTGIQFLL
jgi:hypothetical protein